MGEEENEGGGEENLEASLEAHLSHDCPVLMSGKNKMRI